MKTNVQSFHLLFVDDDSDESYLFNEALEHSGLQVKLSKARDGNDLLAFLHTNAKPDVVLIDLNMPYKDGLEALIEIRNNEAFRDLPLVIYSTTSSAAFIQKCYENGANLFIVKPNSFDGMVEVVKRICTINWKQNTKPALQNFVLTDLHN